MSAPKTQLKIVHDESVLPELCGAAVVPKVDGVRSHCGHYELCMTSQCLCIAVPILLQQTSTEIIIRYLQTRSEQMHYDNCGWLWIEAGLWCRILPRVYQEFARSDMPECYHGIHELEEHPITKLAPAFILIRPCFFYYHDWNHSKQLVPFTQLISEQKNGIPCDGLVFTQTHNHDNPLFFDYYKWKPAARCTLDLVVCLASHSYVGPKDELHVIVEPHPSNPLFDLSQLDTLTLKENEIIQQIRQAQVEVPLDQWLQLQSGRCGQAACIECTIALEPEFALSFYRIRPDRNTGDSVQRALQTVQMKQVDICKHTCCKSTFPGLGHISRQIGKNFCPFEHIKELLYKSLVRQYAHFSRLCFDFGCGTKENVYLNKKYTDMLQGGAIKRMVLMDIRFAQPVFLPQPFFLTNTTCIEIQQDLSQPIDMTQFPLRCVGNGHEVVAFCFMAIAQICKSGYSEFCQNLRRLRVNQLVLVFMDHSDMQPDHEYKQSIDNLAWVNSLSFSHTGEDLVKVCYHESNLATKKKNEFFFVERYFTEADLASLGTVLHVGQVRDLFPFATSRCVYTDCDNQSVSPWKWAVIKTTPNTSTPAVDIPIDTPVDAPPSGLLTAAISTLCDWSFSVQSFSDVSNSSPPFDMELQRMLSSTSKWMLKILYKAISPMKPFFDGFEMKYNSDSTDYSSDDYNNYNLDYGYES